MDELKVEPIVFNGISGEIRTSLITPSGTNGKLAVVLPGAGYSCRQPLLYFAIQALLAKRLTVLQVDKVYGEDPKWANLSTMEEALAVVKDDSVRFFDQISKRFPERIDILLGRSLGTYAIACALEKQVIHPKKIVWQTPSLNDKWSAIKASNVDGFAIIGTADPRFKEALPYLPKDRIVIEYADHAMEIPGKPLQSIEILKTVTEAMDKWVGH